MKLPELYKLLSNELQSTGTTAFMLDGYVVHIDANYTSYTWSVYDKLGQAPIDTGTSELPADNLIKSILKGEIL